MNPTMQNKLHVTRRHFLRDCQLGLGGIALASLMNGSATADPPQADPLRPRASHFPGKAKNVIYLHMAGSPPHLDLFDYKLELVRQNNQPCPRNLPICATPLSP